MDTGYLLVAGAALAYLRVLVLHRSTKRQGASCQRSVPPQDDVHQTEAVLVYPGD